jgi:hypothetical protein
MTWLTVMEYLCHKWPRICSTCRKHFPAFLHSRLITGFVTRWTRWVPLVEHELLTLPKHLSSPPVFSGFRVTRSLVFHVCFVDRCLSFCRFLWPLCCLFFFDIRILIAPLVSSNSSYKSQIGKRGIKPCICRFDPIRIIVLNFMPSILGFGWCLTISILTTL